jgi:hypothetical protein
MIRTAWYIYTQAIGIIAIAAAISLGAIRIVSTEGPVVEVVGGPYPISTKIPYLELWLKMGDGS